MSLNLTGGASRLALLAISRCAICEASRAAFNALTMEHLDFWPGLDDLVRTSTLCIDRPKGTAHPRYPNFIYPLDYGYLEGTQAADGGGIDVWVGSLPTRQVTAVVFTVDRVKRDAEIKLLLGCTPDEAQLILRTHDDGPQSAVLIVRLD